MLIGYLIYGCIRINSVADAQRGISYFFLIVYALGYGFLAYLATSVLFEGQTMRFNVKSLLLFMAILGVLIYLLVLP